MAKKNVGFVGLGKIGSKMAMRLLEAGFPLSVFDLRPEALRTFREMGARIATSSRDVAKDVDILILMVVDFRQAEEVLFGSEGAVDGLRKGAIVACMSTIAPSEVRQLDARLGQYGIRTLDAPVSRGMKGAEEGTLSIMAGAAHDVMEDAKQVLEAMGKRIFWVGDVGNGQVLKMMNQLLCSVELVSIAEALVLGAKAGIDGETLFNVTKETSGNSEMFMAKVPKIIAGDFSSAGDLDIHVKDLEIVTSTARELGVPLILTNVAKEILKMGQAMGRGKLDSSAIITVLEDIVGTRARRRES